MRTALSINHVAMPTDSTEDTYRFYTEVLGFKLVAAVREERVPSTGEATPFLHTFFAMEDGTCMAFFEIDGLSMTGRDDGVPKWVRHFAMNVDTHEELLAWKTHLESKGVDVLGVTDHEGTWLSIYFFDPNGLRLELTWQSRPLTDDDASSAEALVQSWMAQSSGVRGATAPV